MVATIIRLPCSTSILIRCRISIRCHVKVHKKITRLGSHQLPPLEIAFFVLLKDGQPPNPMLKKMARTICSWYTAIMIGLLVFPTSELSISKASEAHLLAFLHPKQIYSSDEQDNQQSYHNIPKYTGYKLHTSSYSSFGWLTSLGRTKKGIPSGRDWCNLWPSTRFF